MGSVVGRFGGWTLTPVTGGRLVGVYGLSWVGSDRLGLVLTVFLVDRLGSGSTVRCPSTLFIYQHQNSVS